MIPLSVRNQDISYEHAVAFRLVCELFKILPDGLSCHNVCEECMKVVGKDYPTMRHVRGWFHGRDHSWLTFEGSNVLIDVYPWAGVVPFMITLVGSPASNPWLELYVEDTCPQSTTP